MMLQDSHNTTNGIVLFDGLCNFCNYWVRWIIRNDEKGYFRFASLQSIYSKNLLKQFGNEPNFNSVVLIEDGQLYSGSTALIRISRGLSGIWKLASFIFSCIPKVCLDLIYNWISQHRYEWFGKSDSCPIPSPELIGRFIDAELTDLSIP